LLAFTLSTIEKTEIDRLIASEVNLLRIESSLLALTLDSSTTAIDYYAVLSLTAASSLADIKAAYHRALLRSHPDKNITSAPPSVDIASIQEAYRVLSTPNLRVQYDRSLRAPAAPRPAQIISLEEFQEHAELDAWSHGCRCGGAYRISAAEMEKGQHLIPCTSCSEIVWVGYELAED
jgi:diphthamide biosynthesis protein 4